LPPRTISASSLLVGVVVEDDAGRLARQQPRQLRIAGTEGQGPQVLAIEFQEIKRVQDGLCGLAAAVQSIEDGEAVAPTTTASNLPDY
jgi:hypothetical protein